MSPNYLKEYSFCLSLYLAEGNCRHSITVQEPAISKENSGPQVRKAAPETQNRFFVRSGTAKTSIQLYSCTRKAGTDRKPRRPDSSIVLTGLQANQSSVCYIDVGFTSVSGINRRRYDVRCNHLRPFWHSNADPDPDPVRFVLFGSSGSGKISDPDPLSTKSPL